MNRLEELFAATPTPSVEGEETRLQIAGSVHWDRVSLATSPMASIPMASVTANGDRRTALGVRDIT